MLPVAIAVLSIHQILCHDLFTFAGWIPCQQWILKRQNHVHLRCSISPPNSQLHEGKRSPHNHSEPFTTSSCSQETGCRRHHSTQWQNPVAFGRVHLLNASWLWSGLFQNPLQQQMCKTHKLTLMSILGKHFYINYSLFLICCVHSCLKIFPILNTHTHTLKPRITAAECNETGLYRVPNCYRHGLCPNNHRRLWLEGTWEDQRKPVKGLEHRP